MMKEKVEIAMYVSFIKPLGLNENVRLPSPSGRLTAIKIELAL